MNIVQVLRQFWINLCVKILFGQLVLAFTGGKSAILTALCVAFGCRAKGTQRASSLKDFIKTGCRFVSFAFVLFLLPILIFTSFLVGLPSLV